MQRFPGALLQNVSRSSTSALAAQRTARSYSKLSAAVIQQQWSSTSGAAVTREVSTRASFASSSTLSPAKQSLYAGKRIGGARSFGSSSVAMHGGKGRPAPGTGITVHFKNHKGELIKTVEGNEGDDIVDLSWEYDLDIEAACEKSIACSTCHVILDADSYDKLEEPTDEENDMLDMAFGLEDTSRLGCQCKLTKELDGMTISLPSATRNFAVDGHKSKH